MAPKTLTPGSRTRKVGLRFLEPRLGRWISRDPINAAELGRERNVHAYVANEPIRHIDVLGMFIIVVPQGDKEKEKQAKIAAEKEAEGPRVVQMTLAMVKLCPKKGDKPVQVTPVTDPPQCCPEASCKKQAFAFSESAVHHATAVRIAELQKYGDIWEGWYGNGRRNTGGNPGLGGDGYLCWEWANEMSKLFKGALDEYHKDHTLCFRAAHVSKGKENPAPWDPSQYLWDAYHEWLLVFGPLNKSPAYSSVHQVLAVDPWPTAGRVIVPQKPDPAERVANIAEPKTFW